MRSFCYIYNIMNEFYKKVTFADLYDSNNNLVGCKEESPKESGVIFANYIPVTRTEPDPEYNTFMKQYALDHALCPKCGAKGHSTTYVGYILRMDKKDDYMDLNRCVCSECGDVHTTHDRVKINLIKDNIIMKVKIFRSYETASVELEMNEWFDKHQTITITNILQSESAVVTASGVTYEMLTISVFYKA